MKKSVILRSALGFPLGISIEYLITIAYSLIWGQGYYSPCVPELANAMGNEIRAVLLQTFLSGVLGSGFGAASLIWEIDAWSIFKQTGIYFLTVSLFMLPIAWLTCWMEHSITGFLSYFGIFVFIFALVWIIQYLSIRQKIRKLNESLHQDSET